MTPDQSEQKDATATTSQRPVTASRHDDETNQQHQPHQYPDPLRLSAIVFSQCMAVFLCGLDQTIIATAVPKISDDFHALGDVGWWTSAYLLTTATFQLFYGKMYSLAPVKYVYLGALLVFNIGSLICATAPNSIALILGRAIAGVGAAGLMSGAVLILAQSAPLEKRAGLLGLVTGMFGLASVAGPFIGGALADKSTWRWCFAINLPLGVLTMVAVAFFVAKISSPSTAGFSAKEKLKRFNLPGMIMVLACLVCLILALQLGGSKDPWNSARVIALLVVFGVLFLVFLCMERWLKGSQTVSTAIVKSRSLWFAGLFAACSSAAMFVAVTYLPIYFQAIRHASALRSGVMLTPLILAFIVMSALAGALTNMIGYTNPAMITGAVLTSIGSGLLTTFDVNTSSSQWIGYQVLFGFGIGCSLQQPMLVVQAVLPGEDVPFGVALISLFQMVGGAIFVAVSQSVFQNGLVDIHTVFPNVETSTLLQTGATNIPMLFDQSQLPRVLEIYSNAVVNTFYVALALSCTSIIGALGTEWKSMKEAPADDGLGKNSESLEKPSE
ncbi:uncharacterized protein EAE98_002481 [Botrytis deweyae]|uniref:Major facilitator superfamily (MFS) profile domain-containing protein n=1 Tax=Botrytis deweyae TaxID=2478750 RepID=A0ABQ7IXA1_9HELO|nr:uncharacterized protein EAE98_002481 [Botrytis deweyae]KAF7936262.1 hypothetical protein EAE98_002481 [Botrytis deweyae]